MSAATSTVLAVTLTAVLATDTAALATDITVQPEDSRPNEQSRQRAKARTMDNTDEQSRDGIASGRAARSVLAWGGGTQ